MEALICFSSIFFCLHLKCLSPLIFDSFLSSRHSLYNSPFYLSLTLFYRSTLSSFPPLAAPTVCSLIPPHLLDLFLPPPFPSVLLIHTFSLFICKKRRKKWLFSGQKWVEKKAESESRRRENGEKKGGMLPEEMMKPKNDCQGDREGKMEGRRDSLLRS